MTSASVVICAYTEERWRQLCEGVASVDGQVPTPAEVILVIDHNDTLLDRARAAWPQHVVRANDNRRGLSGARNAGVEVATGDVVAFLDDDAKAEPGWLARLLDPFEDPTVGGVGGGVRPSWAVPAPAWFPREFLWVVGCSYEGLPAVRTPVRNPIGANMAFRRHLLVETGGFREEVGRVGSVPSGCEETEISIRVARAGSHVVYDPSALVSHLVTAERATFRYFRRRCVAEGRSKAMVAMFAGANDALSSERTYTTRTLPRGIARSLRQAVTGPERLGSLARAAAIVVGLLLTAAGYADGTIRRRVDNTFRIDGSAVTNSDTKAA